MWPKGIVGVAWENNAGNMETRRAVKQKKMYSRSKEGLNIVEYFRERSYIINSQGAIFRGESCRDEP